MTDSEIDSNDMEFDEEQKSGTGSDSESGTDEESSENELYDEHDAEENSDEDGLEEEESADASENEEPEEKIIDKGENSNLPTNPTKSDLKKRLEQHKGRSLYIRFAKKPPTDTEVLEKSMKDVCKYIVNVRRPRQTSTRFCLVDFATKEDCDMAMEELKDVEINGRKLIVQRPITEEENFEEKILERRRQIQERKLHWQNMKRSANSVPHKPNRAVSSLFIRDIPTGTTLEQLKEAFPKSIHVDLRTTKNNDWLNAVVTMPSPKDAFEEKQRSIKIGESTLKLYFAREFNQQRPGFVEGRFSKRGNFLNRGSSQFKPFKNNPTKSLDTKGSNKKLRKKSEVEAVNPVEKILDGEDLAKKTPKVKATSKEDHAILNIEKPGKKIVKSKQVVGDENDKAIKKQKNVDRKRKLLDGSEPEKKNKKQKTFKKLGTVENNVTNGKIKLIKQKVKA